MNPFFKRFFSSLSSTLILATAGIPAPTAAQLAGGNAGCPTGTRENPVSLVRNGIFSVNAGTGLGVPTAPAPVPAAPDFLSDLPYRGDVVYPSDVPVPGNPFTGGGLSIQDERVNGGVIPGAPVGVVSGRGVTAPEASQLGVGIDAIPTYLYSNPNLNTAGVPVTIPPQPPGFPAPVIWRQTLTVAPSTVYNFKALFFNLLQPGAPGLNPRIRLQVGPGNIQTPQAIAVGDGSPIPGYPTVANIRQAWIPVQFSFTTLPGQTTIELRIVDETQNISGDDFGLTAIGLRECLPNIGVAKQAGTAIANADGTFTIPYQVTVRNLAPAVGFPDPYLLNNVQLRDNLAATFANATLLRIDNLQSPTLAVNPGFNGTTDTRLLQENVNALPASAEAFVRFNVTIRPGTGTGGRGPYENTVEAVANTISGIRVLDRSNDGTNTDPDGDGDPSNNNTPTIVTLPDSPSSTNQGNLILVKRLTAAIRDGAPLPDVNFSQTVDDPTTPADTDPAWGQSVFAGFPVGATTLPSGNALRSGDQVEYTIYFLSNGTAPATDVSLCDAIPEGTTLIPGSPQVQLGTAIAPGGTVFSPLEPLPPNHPCSDPRNPNGAVIFTLGDLPNTPPNNGGFVRFRVRIN